MPAQAAPPPTTTAPAAAKPAPSSQSIPPSNESTQLTGLAAENKFAKDAFADLDSLSEHDGKNVPAKVQPKKESAKSDPTSADGADSPSDTSTTKTDSEGQESARNVTEDTKATSDQKPQKAKELREAYESVKKWKQENEPKLKKLSELESKLKEYESKAPEKEQAIKQKIEASEKRLQELESALRLADYQKSSEYKQHQTNLSEAWAEAEQKLIGIKISRGVDDQGQKIERLLTMDDVAGYANTKPAERWDKLRAEIPDPAERTAVINHINELSKVAVVAQKAEAKAKEDADTYSKTQKEQAESLHQTRTKLWRESNEALLKQHPQWFAPVEGDTEGNTILNRGVALADLAMFPHELTDEAIDLLPKSVKELINSKKPFSEQQVQKLRSIVRNKAANHDRLVHQNKSLQKELAEARKALKEYEESGPDNVQARPQNGVKSGIEDAGAELEAISRKYPGAR